MCIRDRVLNTINFSKSLHYNPFAYIRSEKDILKLVTTIIVNTKGEGEKASEDFWVKAEKLLYTALIAFIWYEGDEEEKNLNTLLDLLNERETREEDETYQNPVDMMFQEPVSYTHLITSIRCLRMQLSEKMCIGRR